MKLERAIEIAKEAGYDLQWDASFNIYKLINTQNHEYVGIRAHKIASLEEAEFINDWLTF